MNGRSISVADFFSGFAGALICCLSSQSQAMPTPTPQLVVEANSAFAFSLFQEVASEQPGINLFISPYSASTALQMVAMGAAGTTLDQMQQVLNTKDIARPTVYEFGKEIDEIVNAKNTNFVLNAANAIWCQIGFPIERDFLQGNAAYFGATIGAVDFIRPATVNVINNWASEETHGKINKIVAAPMDPTLRVLVANAVYFHGNWQFQFKTSLTTNAPFHLAGGSQASVPMMHQTGSFGYLSTDKYQAIRLPYQGSNVSMYIFLPNPNSSVEEILAGMSGSWWQQTGGGQFIGQTVNLALPKFSLSYAIELNAPLEALGMTAAFSPEEADFSGISPLPLYISKAKQQAIVDVDETGTEAAAVTTIGLTTSVVEIPPSMTVDRPFLFFIQDEEAETILFMGAVFNPQ
jgi:serine protease inhibitor